MMAVNGWERYTRKDGTKDVRPVGSKNSFGTVPSEYKAAKRHAVQAEVRARDLAAAERQAAQISRELAAKAPPRGPSAVDQAKADVERLISRAPSRRG